MLSRGIHRIDRHQSPFSIKSTAPEAFRELFRLAAARSVPLLLSYSPYAAGTLQRPRMLEVADLLELAKTYYARTAITSVEGVAHSRLNLEERRVAKDGAAEVLVACESPR